MQEVDYLVKLQGIFKLCFAGYVPLTPKASPFIKQLSDQSA